MRLEYQRGALERGDLDPDPIRQLSLWLDQAVAAHEVEPTAMCLATEMQGRPSARMVLMRGIGPEGLVFYTNEKSRKGRELLANSQVAACFWWSQLERQVRVEGAVKRLSAEQSDQYFASRPRDSQISAIVSPQSQVIPSREVLESAAREVQETNRPAHWGGFVLQPDQFEFWQGREARLHDRFRYQLRDGKWVIERLAP